MRRAVACVAVVLAALTSCGSDDSDATDEPTAPPTPEPASCAESFNADAPDGFALIVRLSHDDTVPILTGEFAGDEFEAEVYDTSLDGDGASATVVPGACVVTEVSDSGTVFYVFAEGADGEWHRFLESDPGVPLSTDPASQLEGLVEVTLEEGQTSDSPDLVPATS